MPDALNDVGHSECCCHPDLRFAPDVTPSSAKRKTVSPYLRQRKYRCSRGCCDYVLSQPCDAEKQCCVEIGLEPTEATALQSDSTALQSDSTALENAEGTTRHLRRWQKIALVLAIFTIVYNIVEGVVSILFGITEGSISLAGFGADSAIEVLSASIVLWKLIQHDFRKGKSSVQVERAASFAIAVLLVVLALSAFAGAIFRLVTGGVPDTSIPGLAISSLSLSFMFALWFWKKKAAKKLNSMTLAKDAECSLGCIHLSCVLFLGSLIQLLTTTVFETSALWWVDAAATILIGLLILWDGIATFIVLRRTDFDGGCCGGCSFSISSAISQRLRRGKEGDSQQRKACGGSKSSTPVSKQACCSSNKPTNRACCSEEVPQQPKAKEEASCRGCCQHEDAAAVPNGETNHPCCSETLQEATSEESSQSDSF